MPSTQNLILTIKHSPLISISPHSVPSPKSVPDRKSPAGFSSWRRLRHGAKTISAYDKEVSDDLYGSGSRYVSKQRLEAMLGNEWAQLLTQLQKTRGSHTRFFSLWIPSPRATSPGTNDPHGWIGLRFQSQPGGLPMTSCCTSICSILPTRSRGSHRYSRRHLIHAAFYELQPRNLFWRRGTDVVKNY